MPTCIEGFLVVRLKSPFLLVETAGPKPLPESASAGQQGGQAARPILCAAAGSVLAMPSASAWACIESGLGELMVATVDDLRSGALRCFARRPPRG